MKEYGIILFRTTSAVMQVEKILLKAGVKISLIPVPREFSSDCGISVRFERENEEQVKKLLEEKRIEYEGLRHLPAREKG